MVVPLWAAIVNDGSFEVPETGGTYPYGNSLVYGPTHPVWSFSAYAGLQQTGESGTYFQEPTPIPDGQHFAFAQGVGASISQTITLPADGDYTLQYSVAGRQSDPPFGGTVTYQVMLDATILATDSTVDYQPWTLRSYTFNASAGSYVLKFLNVAIPPTSGGDETVLFDAVSVNPVPEPAAGGLLLGLSALAFAIRRKIG